MAAKPSSLPRWADVGGAIVEPPDGKKDVGWVTGEKPPAQYFNWWKNLVYQWTDYLDDGSFTGAFALASDISPAAITGSQNDYNPTSLSTAQVIRQDLSGNATLTGLAGGADGRILILINIDAAFKLTLTDEDAGSSAANRFSLGGSSVILEPGGSVILIYDSTSTRWRVAAAHKCSREITFYIPGRAGYELTSGWSKNAAGYATPTAAAALGFGLGMLALGDRITNVAAAIQADNVNTLTLSLQKITGGGSHTTEGTPDVSTTGGGTQFEALAVGDMSSVDIGTDGACEIVVEASASDTDLRLYFVSVTVTRRIA